MEILYGREAIILGFVYLSYITTEHNGGKDKISSFKHTRISNIFDIYTIYTNGTKTQTFYGSARGVMVILVGNGYRETSSNPGLGLTAFYIALIPLGKV